MNQSMVLIFHPEDANFAQNVQAIYRAQTATLTLAQIVVRTVNGPLNVDHVRYRPDGLRCGYRVGSQDGEIHLAHETVTAVQYRFALYI